MSTPSNPLAQNAFDPVAERAERQMRVMEQLAEIGMGLARALVAQVCEGAPVTLPGDPALIYSRIARTVRQCIALEAKIGEALREWLGLSEAERAERRAAVGAKASGAPVELEIEDSPEIERAAEERRGETERGERAERPERFWADSYVIEDESSFVEIVAKACRALGVTPDWSSWSEGGPGDLAVTPDRANGFWREGEPEVAAGPFRMGRIPPQRGPPS
jgi:hypothetical protein